MSEKPLHVRVAEALGYEPASHPNLAPGEWWVMPDHDPDGSGYTCELPRYDTDWSAIGPEVKRLGIHIIPEGRKWVALKELPQGAMVAFAHEPQEAAAKLIVDLKESGVSLA
jgi:hypothetical protein